MTRSFQKPRMKTLILLSTLFIACKSFDALRDKTKTVYDIGHRPWREGGSQSKADWTQQSLEKRGRPWRESRNENEDFEEEDQNFKDLDLLRLRQHNTKIIRPRYDIGKTKIKRRPLSACRETNENNRSWRQNNRKEVLREKSTKARSLQADKNSNKTEALHEKISF